MHTKIGLTVATAISAVCILGQVLAAPRGGSDGPGADRGGVGPDVTVSRIGLDSSGSGNDFAFYGVSNNISAFSMASTSCNIGDATAQWVDGAPAHPVIAQNVYRLENGRFEQIGMSWLKHSFCAVSEPTCGSCQSTGCGTLGIGCADTYWATLNGGQSDLGPRSQINPQGLGWGNVITTYPHALPTGNATIRGRLQINRDDIVTTPGVRYFGEIHYVTHDENIAQRVNNASWREITLSDTAMNAVGVGQGSVRFTRPAIQAWKEADPAVTIRSIDVPGEGRFHVAYKVTDNGDGTWNYEYAVHNMSSHQSADGFSVPVPAGVDVTNIGFHDATYHSGEPFDGTDWTATVENGEIRWATQTFAENENANALRWGTLYNFRFTANAPSQPVSATIDLFRPGTASEVLFNAAGPIEVIAPCPGDLTGNGAPADGTVDLFDLLDLLANWGTDGSGADIAEPTTVVDLFDLLDLLAAWGPC